MDPAADIRDAADPEDAAGGVGPVAGLGDLPGAARDQALALASGVLGSLALTDIPPRLRPFARFAPRRRARFAAAVLADALDDSPGFRQQVGRALADAGQPSVGATGPGRLAWLWLVRPAGWAADLAQAAGQSEPTDRARSTGSPDPADGRESEPTALSSTPASDPEDGRVRAAGGSATVRHLADSLDAARADARRDRVLAKKELAAVQTALRSARAAAAAADREAHTAREELRAVRAEAESDRGGAAAALRAADADQRRLRRRIEDLTAEVALARRDTRAGREFAEARVELLLQTLDGAVAGLTRELGVRPPATLAPVDTVPAREAPAADQLDARAESWDAPATLARFLALPKAHLLVDGYNVTKAALPTLPLSRQRDLLLRNLSGLAAQTGAEVTVVFDGADVTAVPAVGVPGIRVRFSPLGVTADAVLRAMARAEPPGRPVVVVSSDREVADGVRRAGATAVGAGVLVRRLLGG